MNTNNLPLVSVAVITYNSAKTVLETLDSIYAQTYKNIELIVSDDCSTDDTKTLVQDWLISHRHKFVNVECILSDTNTGVSGNCNRALSNVHGDWLKVLAGDDLLVPFAIEHFVSFVLLNPDSEFVFSRVRAFGNNKDMVLAYNQFDYSVFSLSSEQLYMRLIKGGDGILCVGQFLSKKIIDRESLQFDERIPNQEDRPFWINALKHKIKFSLLDEELVYYRISEHSLTTGLKDSCSFRESTRLTYFYYSFPIEYAENPDLCIRKIVDYETDLYVKYRDAFYELYAIKKHIMYRVLMRLNRIFRKYFCHEN